MKQAVIILLALVLCSCTTKPDLSKIKRDATAKLQAQVDASFGTGKAKVSAIELVQTTPPRYEGAATIAIGGKSTVLPVAVTSDGETTIITADESKIGALLKQKEAAAVATLADKYSDYIFSPSLFARMPERLQRDKALFKGRMEVIVPIEEVADGYLGTGCKAHSCGSDEAAWFLSKDGVTAAAVIMETSYPTELGQKSGIEPSLVFHIYGATEKTLPSPLAQWASDKGMSHMNIAGDGVEYLPPAKN